MMGVSSEDISPSCGREYCCFTFKIMSFTNFAYSLSGSNELLNFHNGFPLLMSFTFNSIDTSAWAEQYPGEILAFLLENLTLERRK